MAWNERIKECKIITGNGETFVVEFQDIGRTREERATVFKFSEFSGDQVQKLSSGGNSFNFVIWFSGPDCDLIADRFEESTKDIRPIIFIHPLKKTNYNCQLLSLSRNDSLVSAANEVSFNIELHETIKGSNPKNINDIPDEIEILSQNSSLAFSDNFIEVIDKKNKYSTGISNINTFVPYNNTSNFLPLNATKNELLKIINIVSENINIFFNDAFELIGEFESVKLSAINLVQTIDNAPKSAALVIKSLIGFVGSTDFDKEKLNFSLKKDFYTKTYNDLFQVNDIKNFEMIYPSLVVGLCQSLVKAKPEDFKSRKEISSIIDSIFEWMLYFFNRIDILIQSDNYNNYIQDSESINNLTSIVSKTNKFTDELIYKQKQLRTITINNKSDILTIVYKIYGAISIDDLEAKFKEFLDINNIRGTKIFGVSPGTNLIYYS